MKLQRISLLFVLLTFVSCNYIKNPQETSLNNPSHNKKIENPIENLEILDIPYCATYPDEKNKNWKPVKFPVIHKMPEPFLVNISNIWIRGQFKIKELKKLQPYEYYAINLRWIGFIKESVYINNQFVDEFDLTQEWGKWFYPRNYILPADIKLKEKNEIYIRIVTNWKYATLLSDILLQNKSSYLYSQKWYNLFYNQLPMGFSILCIGLCIILLRNFFHFNNKRYLLYSFYIFYICIITFLIYFPANPLIVPLHLTLYFAQQPLLGLLLPVLIIQSFYEIYFTKQNVILSVIVLLVIIYNFIHLFIINFYSLEYISPNFILLPFYLYYIYLIYSLNKHKPDRFILKIVVILFILKALFDFYYVFALTINFGYVIFTYLLTTPVYAVFIIIYESRETRKRKFEIDRMNKILEKNNNNSLTESAEQKIEKIIGFLNENYTSNISREGLASAVDMHHDYMSRLFYKHTGKKINEYINQLRITNAIEQLKNSQNGKNIIDVAVAVGFDSLPTFDRIFKEITGLTPRAYKKDITKTHSISKQE
jgi:AraC-like DNA-binding protein